MNKEEFSISFYKGRPKRKWHCYNNFAICKERWLSMFLYKAQVAKNACDIARFRGLSVWWRGSTLKGIVYTMYASKRCQREVVQLLTAGNMSSSEIYCRMQLVYGTVYVPASSIHSRKLSWDGDLSTNFQRQLGPHYCPQIVITSKLFWVDRR